VITAEEVIVKSPLLLRGELTGEEGDHAFFRARHG
jgi:hypothetical protein